MVIETSFANSCDTNDDISWGLCSIYLDDAFLEELEEVVCGLHPASIYDMK